MIMNFLHQQSPKEKNRLQIQNIYLIIPQNFIYTSYPNYEIYNEHKNVKIKPE